MRKQTSTNDANFVCMRVWAAFCVALFAFTWKLWLPGFTEFPRVPLFGSLDVGTLTAVHYTASSLLIAALVALVFGIKRYRWCAIGVAISLSVLFCCNQHCLQPWAWQVFIIVVLLACLPIYEAKVWIARVLISIYFYSAIGKFDYQFIHSTGQEFLEVVLSWFGQSDSISNLAKHRLTLLFPIGELLIAIGLMIRRTEKLAACIAILSHVALMLVLSPLGLGHRWPVVIWNGLSILLVVWLFLLRRQAVGFGEHRPTIATKFAVVFAIVILVGPLLRPVQLWDHWLAWGLYSPSNSRVEVFVSDSSAARLKEPVGKYLVDSDVRIGSKQFSLDRWSLESLGVPIYPQGRVQKAAAIQWLRENELLDSAALFEYGQSHPISGERSKKVVTLPKQ